MDRTALRVCPLCEATCGLSITLSGETVTRVRGNPDDVFSQGYLCPKGASLGRFDDDPDRLTAPLVRRPDGGFDEVGWAEAFAAVDRGLRAAAERHGKDAVALYMGNPVIHTLALPLYMLVLRERLGTRNIYSSTTLDTMPKSTACGWMYGDPLAFPLPDIDRTDHLLVLGANPAESNGSLWTVANLPGRLKALRARGGRLVVVDPRRTRTADLADQHIAVRPGTDPLLLLGILHTLLGEGLATDPGEGFAGFGELADLVKEFGPDDIAPACGVPADTVRGLARDLAAAPTAAVYGRLGTSTTEFGTLTSWLVDVVNIVTGNFDRPGGVLFGEAPHAARRPAEPFRTGRWHSRVRELPEVNGELPTATLADEIATPGPGQVRALLCVAGNLVLATPQGERLDEVLPGLDFMVCVDPYLNETTRHASVILPPPSPLQSPHYDVVLAGRSVRRNARFSPPARALEPGRPAEAEILARLVLIASGKGPGGDWERVDEQLTDLMLRAARGRPGSPLARREAADLKAALTGADALERRLDLMLRLGPVGDLFGVRPGGLNLARLKEAPNGVDIGPLRPRRREVVMTASGLVELCPPAITADLPRLAARMRDLDDGRLVLISRRQLKSVNSWSHNIASLSGGSNRCTLELSEEDARRLGVTAGDPVRVRSRTGEVVVPAEPTDRLRPGVVSMPYGWGHGRDRTRLPRAAAEPGVSVNALTDGTVVDPLSGTAVFNGVPVHVEPVSAKQAEK
ncbi:molybdopterin dinucleotide binding domain-containing protein [Streptomyces sp. SHP 1-2]|uniref:molybdopterin dinucleotide binding domain-containing protein n=1 Tax=Streptomyces sp. SHP 1-2 TaxID=2769489 RepID=UPI002236F8B3|nr:molybdopterin dinucleotide binding domain-containing protein [Streptomyces sp. SHP 1-2]MCW5254567.1 molybdopterin-dependent oxidoreductase [Streptomyces sp. SHP 1-2]